MTNEPIGAVNKHSPHISDGDARFRAIYETIRDGMLIADDCGQYLDANPAACELLGMKRQRIIGLKVEDFADPHRKEEVQRQWDQFLEHGFQKGVFRIFRPDGTTRHVEYTAKAHIVPHQHLSIFRDITERDRAEKSIRESEDRLRRALETAEAAMRAKSQFIANISHEIRTPINGILGTIELLRLMPLTAEQREYVDIMESSGDTLITLVGELLDFSRIEAGKMKIATRAFDLSATLKTIFVTFKERALQKGLQFRFRRQGHIPSHLRGDAIRMRQVLINLVGNAIKFTEKGRVRMTVTKEKEETSRVVLKFSVKDTGPGIPRRQQSLLFKPFSQADASTMRRHGGTGLGLAISKQLVELMGGTIGLKSHPGQGSTFWFSVPFLKGSLLRASRHVPSFKPQSSVKPPIGRVLIAEDNPVNRLLAVRQLEKLGCTAETARNGREVLDALKRQKYDLVLMDCQMPVMDGYQATAEIRRRETRHTTGGPAGRVAGGRRTPIIAMTAHAREEDRKKCLNSGMDDYISKPVHLTRLRAVLQHYVGFSMLVDQKQWKQAFESTGADFHKLVKLYMEDTAAQMKRMQAAIHKKSAQTLNALAHSALGASVLLGMTAVAESLRRLEDMGTRGDLRGATEILFRAQTDLSRTREYLRQIKGRMT